MNNLAFQIYGSKKSLNTFIGGVASTISTKSLLATKLGISTSAISNFSIDGNDIRCNILVNYDIPSSAFAGNTDITYFNDSNGLVNTINNTAFLGCTALSYVEFPNVTNIISSSSGGINGTFQNCTSLTSFIAPKLTTIQNNGYYLLANCSSINTISMPALTTLGGTVGDNNIFYLIKTGCTITVPIVFQTNNSGSPDGDLQYAITTRGATVIYI